MIFTKFTKIAKKVLKRNYKEIIIRKVSNLPLKNYSRHWAKRNAVSPPLSKRLGRVG
jgi:hypothetical protein